MTDGRPLHVRVAEALGWERCHYDGEQPDAPKTGRWFGKCLDVSVLPRWFAPIQDAWIEIPRYDTDWSATGPLIEKYGISLVQNEDEPTEWAAFLNNIGLAWGSDCLGLDGYVQEFEYGSTPLVAVCKLILALKEAGKL